MRKSYTKALYLTCGILVVLVSLSFLSKESTHARIEREKNFSYLIFKKIGVALYQYAEQTGKYPDNLQELAIQYLDQATLAFAEKEKYCYIPGIHPDMPGNVPLILEESCKHEVTIGKKVTEKRGFILFSDMSVFLMLRSGEEPKIILETKAAVQLANNSDISELWKIAQNTKAPNSQRAVALWKLRKLSYRTDAKSLAKLLSSNFLEIARQAALLLWIHDRQTPRYILSRALEHDSYWIRKNTWKTIFPDNTDLAYLLPKTCVQQFWKTP